MSDRYEIHEGDCRTVLATLPAQSVQCCVTSPPYWGLRDYGWDCQIGLEKTPEEYVAELVAVFREVRRVLRDDGVLWLNLGSSYVSRDMPPSQSRAGARACGSGGTEPQDCLETGCVCCGPDDGPRDDSLSHRHCNDCTPPLPEPSEPRHPKTIRGTEHSDSVSTLPGFSPPGASRSTISSLRPSDQGVFSQEATASACSSLLTSSGGDGRSARKAPNTSGTPLMLQTSASRTPGMVSSGSACGDPSCRGCGICFAYSAIPSLSLKRKDLVPIPWLVALALQADGWYLRSDVIWAKPNPMPESVTDRPTKAHEYVFLLSKSARYYYDADAIKEKSIHAGEVVTLGEKSLSRAQATGIGIVPHGNGAADSVTVKDTRNKRTVWTIATQPYPGAHFAVMPQKLAETCVLAGCPREACARCGAPVVRVVRRERTLDGEPTTSLPPMKTTDKANPDTAQGVGHWRTGTRITDLGWRPSCDCDAGTVPGVVIDPFCGAATTGLAALKHGRRFVGVEGSAQYVALAEERLRAPQQTALGVE